MSARYFFLDDVRRLGGQLFAQLLLLVPEPPDVVDAGADAVDVRLLVELAVLLVDVLDDLFDADLLMPQLVGELEDRFDRNRGVQDDLQDPTAPLLHLLGDLDLALAGEQRDGAHLAQVQANGIDARRTGFGRLFAFRLVLVGLFLLARRDRGLIAVGLGLLGLVLFLGQRRATGVAADLPLGAASTISMPSADSSDSHSSMRAGRRDAGRHQLVHLVVGQEALGLALREEVLLVALAVLVRMVGGTGIVAAGLAARLPPGGDRDARAGAKR